MAEYTEDDLAIATVAVQLQELAERFEDPEKFLEAIVSITEIGLETIVAKWPDYVKNLSPEDFKSA